MNPYKELADGIVRRAVSDYTIALKRLQKGYEVDLEIYELENFFRSAWFKMLSDLDGEKLIRAERTRIGL